MFSLKKFKSKRGQHSAEYVILLISVMVAIIIAGPYVIRSWNALMKSFEEDNIDSHNDPLLLAPAVNVDPCECHGPYEEGCFLGGCGFGSQAGTPVLWAKYCTPIGCDPDPFECRPDLNAMCCDPWVDNVCGGGPCAPSLMHQTSLCSDGSTKDRCVPSPFCNVCIGSFIPGQFPKKERLCPGDDANVGAPTLYTYIEEGECSNAPHDATKCNVECLQPFVPNVLPAGGHCQCPPGFFESPPNEDCLQCGTPSTSPFCYFTGTRESGCPHVNDIVFGSSEARCPPGQSLLDGWCDVNPHDNLNEHPLLLFWSRPSETGQGWYCQATSPDAQKVDTGHYVGHDAVAICGNTDCITTNEVPAQWCQCGGSGTQAGCNPRAPQKITAGCAPGQNLLSATCAWSGGLGGVILSQGQIAGYPHTYECEGMANLNPGPDCNATTLELKVQCGDLGTLDPADFGYAPPSGSRAYFRELDCRTGRIDASLICN